jgi:hypothetical protein
VDIYERSLSLLKADSSFSFSTIEISVNNTLNIFRSVTEDVLLLKIIKSIMGFKRIGIIKGEKSSGK